MFPKPEDLKRRYDKRFKETGKKVPTDALNNMIGIFLILFLYLLSARVKFYHFSLLKKNFLHVLLFYGSGS